MVLEEVKGYILWKKLHNENSMEKLVKCATDSEVARL